MTLTGTSHTRKTFQADPDSPSQTDDVTRTVTVDLHEALKMKRGALPRTPLSDSVPRELCQAVAVAGSSTRRGMRTSRAITRRWICDVPS